MAGLGKRKGKVSHNKRNAIERAREENKRLSERKKKILPLKKTIKELMDEK
jgi:hypothetical protein